MTEGLIWAALGSAVAAIDKNRLRISIMTGSGKKLLWATRLFPQIFKPHWAAPFAGDHNVGIAVGVQVAHDQV